jgi:putative Ca2+/H+ antiporter (TMEM165/GDT1 family)
MIDYRLFATVFATVFLAELGDKTQLATLLYASDVERSRFVVFMAAGSALVVSTGVAVVAGQALGSLVSPEIMRRVAAVGFIAIGLWMLLGGVSD